jgi:GNAT superfamily N-acetyltransferase
MSNYHFISSGLAQADAAGYVPARGLCIPHPRPVMELTFETTETPDPEDVAFIGSSLAAFNDAEVGPADRRTIAVQVRDGEGGIVAGLWGYTAWGWLYVQWLWVAETVRGQGVAGRMLAAAEEEALRRGCHGALIDTFSTKAETLYKRHGYEVFGVLPDFPVGRSRLFLQKRLAPVPR